MYHGDKGWQNMQADLVTDRAIYLDDPIIFRIQAQHMINLSKTYPISMLFLKKSELDWSPAQHLAATLVCLQDVDNFLMECIDSDLISEVNSVVSTEFWNLFDGNLDGYILNCNIVLPRTTPLPC